MRGFLYWVVRLTLKPFLAPWVPIPLQRAWSRVAALSVKGPRGCSVMPISMGTVPGLKLTPAGAQAGRAILYLHGGAYVIGGPGSHGKLAAQLGHFSQATVYFADYRLAPEHPFPAALDDALVAWRWLLDQGLQPTQLTLAGDSAGVTNPRRIPSSPSSVPPCARNEVSPRRTRVQVCV